MGIVGHSVHFISGSLVKFLNHVILCHGITKIYMKFKFYPQLSAKLLSRLGETH